MLAKTMQWLFVVELMMYGGCFVCGIIAAALLTITQGHFSGRCPLYGDVRYNASAQALDLDSSGLPSLCYFLSAISIIVAICCLSFLLLWAYGKYARDPLRRGKAWLSMTLGVCGVFLFLLLVCGCILRAGRHRLCLSVLQSAPLLDSCEQAENETWADPYSGSQFYTGLHSTEAQKSVWVNFFFWVVIVVVVTAQRQWGSEFRVVGEDTDWISSETEPFYCPLSRPN